MKFTIVTTPTNDGWTVNISCPDSPEIKVASRNLKRCGEEPAGFPLPPATDAAVWEQQIHAPLCDPENGDADPIQSLYDDIIYKSDPGPDGVEKFGRYLTAVLLGNNWNTLKTAAQNTSIELDLQFGADDTELTRLPWEMMYGDDRPLAASDTHDVSINRIVPSTVKTTRPITLPLKLLFVIGRQLDDALRPGAEYLGLLRRMKVRFGADVSNMDMNVRLLTETATDELQSMINTFKPDIVHFICHGDIGETGGRLLLTKRESLDVDSRKTLEPDYCDAPRLLGLLRQEDAPHELPQIIVLNACHTGEAGTGEDIKGGYRSLAAKLVEEGVPIVIGMTGEVADGACRIFTRKFYEALMTQSQITLASARGRRSAMLYFTDNYKTSVEWARPTLFMAEGVSSTLAVDGHAAAREMAVIPSRYVLKPLEALCDRFIPLKGYQQFRNQVPANGSPKLLAFKVDEAEVDEIRFGKTRLLEEIAAHAVLDGLIPCAVLSRPSRHFEPSPNLLSLAIRVAHSMNLARKNFSVPERYTSNALDLAGLVLGQDPPPPPDPNNTTLFELKKERIINELSKLGQANQPANPGFQVVRAAMLADFRQLQTDIEAKIGEKRIPILLLDDLHRYEGVADDLLNKMIDMHGLGAADLVVPMVFTYSSVNVSGNGFTAITEFIKNSSKYIFGNLPLQRISDPHEEKLAYCQYLLSREEPLAVSWRSEKSEDVGHLFNVLRSTIKGVPSMFGDPQLHAVLSFAKLSKILVDADDEVIFNNLAGN